MPQAVGRVHQLGVTIFGLASTDAQLGAILQLVERTLVMHVHPCCASTGLAFQTLTFYKPGGQVARWSGGQVAKLKKGVM